MSILLVCTAHKVRWCCCLAQWVLWSERRGLCWPAWQPVMTLQTWAYSTHHTRALSIHLAKYSVYPLLLLSLLPFEVSVKYIITSASAFNPISMHIGILVIRTLRTWRRRKTQSTAKAATADTTSVGQKHPTTQQQQQQCEAGGKEGACERQLGGDNCDPSLVRRCDKLIPVWLGRCEYLVTESRLRAYPSQNITE